MDTDRIEGKAQDLGGKIKDAAGGLLGDSKMQAEGKADQVSGKVQDAYGSAKDAVEDGVQTLGNQLDSVLKNQPLVALLAAAGIGYLIRVFTASPRR